jgi:hypothetical protein
MCRAQAAAIGGNAVLHYNVDQMIVNNMAHKMRVRAAALPFENYLKLVATDEASTKPNLFPLCASPAPKEREFCIDNSLVRIHFITEMIWWTGLAPWEFEFLFPGSLASTFQTHSRVGPG